MQKTIGLNVADKPLAEVHNFCIQNDLELDVETMTIPLVTIEKRDSDV